MPRSVDAQRTRQQRDSVDDLTISSLPLPASSSDGTVKRSTSTHSPGKFRYIVLLLTVLCLTAICSNMIAFNFTLILMRHPNWDNVTVANNSSPEIVGQANNTTDPVLPLLKNVTHPEIPATIAYTPEEKSRLLYIIGLASIVSTFPFSALYTKFGARYIFLVAGLISTVATVLLPLAASHGMNTFMVIRVFQGLSYGANYSVIGFICHRWANLHEHGFFLACMTSFTSIATTLTNLLAGFISSSPLLGWPWVYYVLALFSVISFGLWLLLYSDCPNTHRCVNSHERAHIMKEKSEAEITTNRREHTPFCAIFTDRVVLVIWLNAFAHMVTVVFLITYLPTYVSKVLGYGVRETGIWSSVPTLIQIPLRISLGWLADTMRCMSELNRMRLYNSIALAGSGILFAVTGFVPDHMPFLAIILTTLNLCATSFDSGGLYKCATLISRQYSHYVIAGIQLEKSVTMFLSPIVFFVFITDESSHAQWRVLFIAMAVLLIFANCFFVFLATDQPAEFTRGDFPRRRNATRPVPFIGRLLNWN